MTADSVPAETKSIALEVVRDEPTRAKRGRPVVLTVRLFLKVCHLVEEGWAISRACEAEQVTYSHFRFRVSRSPRLQKRLAEAEAVRFVVRREIAEASIIEWGKRSWMAHAWWLERTSPNSYSLKNVNRAEADEARPVGVEIPESKLQEYGEQMRIFAQREDEIKEAAARRTESALLTNAD